MPKKPTLFQSLFPILVLIGLITLNVTLLGDDTLSGANQLSLLIASGIAVSIALYNKLRWQQMLNGILHTLHKTMPSLLILLMIGILAGTWMLSGIIPSMIYYGLYILRPDYFLPATVVIAAIISVATGSSWSTVATVGLALLGIGHALGFNEAMVAGAIISGAYFGDKVSPLSDTTNLAAATAEVDLFRHIRFMMTTTVPTMLITLALFTVLSFTAGADRSDISSQNVQSALASYFYISPLLFITPVVVIVMILKKMPPIPVLFLGGVLGAITALICQPEVIAGLSGEEHMTAGNAYRVVTRAMYGHIQHHTGNDMLDSLLSSSGMAGMLNTVWLIITAMIFGGIMEAGHFLERITQSFMKHVKSEGALVTTTAGTCVLFNVTASDQYMAIVVPGKMFAKAFRNKGLAPEVLSRILEDSATATSVLIPWNTCGATQASVLGVATVAYAPFAFFCYLSPLMSVLFAWFKIKLRRIPPEVPLLQDEKEFISL